MKVKELIKQLNAVENKDKEVYCYVNEEPTKIIYVDDSITDRVDLNLLGK